MIEIPLHSNRYPGHDALVDDEDFALVSQYRWHVAHNFRAVYAKTNIRGDEGGWVSQTMHRLLMGNPEAQIDHINGDGLDNRRSNLRLSDHSGQAQNRVYRNRVGRGVSFSLALGKWHARASFQGQRYHIGYFEDPVDAALAYDDFIYGHYEIVSDRMVNFPRSSSL